MNFLKSLILAILFIVPVTLSYSQVMLKGKVFTPESQEGSNNVSEQYQGEVEYIPLPGATVIWKSGSAVNSEKSPSGTTTDAHGYFKIRAWNLGDTLQVSMVGYKTVGLVYSGQKYVEIPLNLLICITGVSGSGKTHLSKILIKNARNYKTLYSDRDYQNILDRFEDSDFFILENIDKVKHEKFEQELFHIINLAKENNKKLLMTSRKPISKIDLNLEDLKSRLNSILEVKIKEPDDQLMELLLIKIFNDKQLKINPNIIGFLVSRLERSYESINLFIEKIDNFSLEKGKKITIPLINDLLK